MSKLKVLGTTILCFSIIAALAILPGCKEPEVIDYDNYESFGTETSCQVFVGRWKPIGHLNA